MSEYFSHDYNARNSLALKKISRKYGLEGIGLYWCLIEILFENDGKISEESLSDIAYDLRVDENTITALLDDCDTFERAGGFITSEMVVDRLNIRKEKSEKARQSANKRWENEADKIRTNNDLNANAMRPECERNAIKENKSKENKSKEKKKDIIEIIDYLNEKAGTNYRANSSETVSHISARLSEGFTVGQFKQVIDKKCDDWLNDSRMKDYLRPQTLFGTKFESYLNSTNIKKIDRTDPESYKGSDDTAAFLAAYG